VMSCMKNIALFTRNCIKVATCLAVNGKDLAHPAALVAIENAHAAARKFPSARRKDDQVAAALVDAPIVPEAEVAAVNENAALALVLALLLALLALLPALLVPLPALPALLLLVLLNDARARRGNARKSAKSLAYLKVLLPFSELPVNGFAKLYPVTKPAWRAPKVSNIRLYLMKPTWSM